MASDGLGGLAARLGEAGARDEALGVYEPERRMLGLPVRPERIVVVGRAWRLGDYLLEPSGTLHRVGRVVRVADVDRRRSVVAVAATRYHELRQAAKRGGVAEGETVNFDTSPVDLAEQDLGTLRPYLEDRAELLIRPPAGATD